MCILAFKELIRASKEPNEIPKNYYYVADEINRAELSRVFGELLLCLEEDKRLRIVKEKIDNKEILKVEGTKVQTQNSSLWEKEHAVVILDNENNIVELDENDEYKEDGNKYFGVPENLYFIGTMNDIDRSVDSFDMALRRRFVWKHYTYKKEVLENHYGEKDGLETFLTKCKDLNEYITSEKGFNLPESYILGHSYFMYLPSFSNEQLKKLWSNKIEPLLTEYARVNYEGKELIDKLKIVKEKFILKDKDNK
jgi:5-methylcytosine-specific restriction enzyme B